jgi:hypothetical protein
VNRRTASATAAAVLLTLAALPLGPVAAQTVGPPPGTTADAPARVFLTAIDPVVGPGSVRPAAPVDDGDLPLEGVETGPATDPADAPVPASVTGAGWSLLIEHTGPVAWERVEVVAELHGALGSRSALRTALAGGAVPAVIERVSTLGPPGPIAPGGVVRIDGLVPLTARALTGTDSAVHPLRLRVVADGQPVGGIDTAVVRLGAAPTARLTTSLVWPLSSAPLRDPTGDPSGTLDPLTVRGGAFDTLLSTLAPLVGPDAPDALLRDLARGVALIVPVHLLEDLEQRAAEVPSTLLEDALLDPLADADLPEGVDAAAFRSAVLLRRIRSTALALPTDPVVTAYGDADLRRLLASGPALQAIAARSVLEGERRVPALIGRPAGTMMLLAAPVAPATLDLLPMDTVLLPHAAIDAPDLALDVPLGEPVRTLRSPTGRIVTALVADPYLTDALGASTRALPADPLLAAHEVLVRTAMIHLEAPSRQGRGLVLLPPHGFDPDPRFAAEVVSRLAQAPWLAPGAPAGVVAAAPGPREVVRLAVSPSEPLPGRLVGALVATARDLELLVGAADLPTADPDATAPSDAPSGSTPAPLTDPVLPVGDRSLTEAGDELMRATSTSFTADLDRALALLDGVRAGVDSAFGQVAITLTDVTLTDRDGTVPLTLRRTGGVPLRVRVEVSAPAALAWTDGTVREVTLEADADRSLEIPVRSAATGRFAVSIRVTDPTGERLLAAETAGVRATAVAGPALALIILTVVGLTVLGTVRQRRRAVP